VQLGISDDIHTWLEIDKKLQTIYSMLYKRQIKNRKNQNI